MNVKQCSTEDELTKKLKILKQTKELVNNTQSELGLNFKPFPKQLEFVKLTKKATATYFLAGLGCGKTEIGLQMVKALATGIYPSWWEGRILNRPTCGCIIKSDKQLLKTHIYSSLVGNIKTGLRKNNIPAIFPRHLVHIKKNREQALDNEERIIEINWKGGEQLSTIYLRSAGQGVGNIMGLEFDWVWIDELIPFEYYQVALERIRAKDDNFLFITATPQEVKYQELADHFEYYTDTNAEGLESRIPVPESTVHDYKAYLTACWADNPALSEEKKALLRANKTYEEIQLIEFGKRIVGRSSVFQIPEELFIKPAHEIILQTTWRYINGFDVGLNDATAIVYIAIDEDKDIIYIYDVYKVNNLRPSEHVNRLLTMSKNINIPHMIDKSANNRMIGETKYDIDTVAKQYRHYGVNVILSEDKLLKDLKMSTIGEFHERAYNGKIIISDACKPLIEEMRRYRRDDKGRIIKNNDHAIDAMFYGLLGWRKYAQYLVKSKYTQYPIRYF